MKKTALLVVVAALAVPAAALADKPPKHETTGATAAVTTQTPAPSAKALAFQACKDQRSADAAAFKALYGTNKNKSNAYGKCISAAAKSAKAAVANAAGQCKAWRQDAAAFAAAHGGTTQTFAEFFGSNANGKNAYGKCVSSTAKQTMDAHTTAIVKAEKACKVDHGGFTGKNAFGKCVSSKSKTN